MQGHIEGELSVDGNIRVDTHATIAADVRGHRITVRGAIKGDLSADEAIALEDGARVVGESPRPASRSRREASSVATSRQANPKESARLRPARRAMLPLPRTSRQQSPLPKLRRVKLPAPVVPVLKKGTKAALTKKR